jgi:hypothetical protein
MAGRFPCLYRGHVHQTVQVASLAMSTMWMRVPWFMVEAVNAENLRLLRLAKGR